MLRKTSVALISAALLLAACGDDDGVSAADDQETADKAIAAVEQALRDDGFSATAGGDVDDDLTFESEECREFQEAFQGADQNLPSETASAESDAFERGELEPTGGGVEELIGVGATFVEEPEDFDPLFELLDDERLGRCSEEAFRISFGEDAAEGQQVEVGDVEIEQLGAEGLGDGGGGFQGIAEITTSGITFLLSYAVQFVRVDRALVGVSTFAFGTEEPTADRAALLQTLVDGVRDQSA